MAADAERELLRVGLPFLEVVDASLLRVGRGDLFLDLVVDAAPLLQVLRENARQILVGVRIERRIFPVEAIDELLAQPVLGRAERIGRGIEVDERPMRPLSLLGGLQQLLVPAGKKRFAGADPSGDELQLPVCRAIGLEFGDGASKLRLLRASRAQILRERPARRNAIFQQGFEDAVVFRHVVGADVRLLVDFRVAVLCGG
jgi:hypothetical protein